MIRAEAVEMQPGRHTPSSENGVAVEEHVIACGERLLTSADNARQGTQGWVDTLMARTIVDEDFRVQALRFVDVLPALNDDKSLARHLQEYFGHLDLPHLAEWGLKHTSSPWATRIAAPTVRYTLRGLARKFMGGSHLHHALTSISRLRHKHMNFTLDLLGEATISEAEAEQYQQNYLHMLDSLSTPLQNWHEDALLDYSNGRPSPRLNVSLKLSSLYSQINPAAPEASIHAIGERLRPIFRRAQQQRAFVTLDMEHYDLKHIVLACFKQILMEDEFRHWPDVGLAMQAYLRDTYDDLQDLIHWVEQRGTPVTVRLVRGAYWDYETVIARQQDWDCPVWQNKCDTDANYERCIRLLFEHHPHIETAVAGHNYRSIAYTMALADNMGLGVDQFEFQMLYGMADHMKTALADLGYRLRVYVPYGDTLPGMAYLVRRLLENSSGQSILDFGLSEQHQDIDFSAPRFSEDANGLRSIHRSRFGNCPLLRFTRHSERQHYAEAIAGVRKHLGGSYALCINNQWVKGEDGIISCNPARPDEIVGYVSAASPAQADIALEAALDAFPGWSRLNARQRADYLRRAANLLKKRRMEFAATEVLEAGKNWREADANICEAIDFLNYYAQQAERLGEDAIYELSGEHNQLYRQARGVGLVIPPWNFPLAILTGMLAATIVTGNTAIVKPSSQTPVIAAKLMQLLLDIELPPGVVNFLPGSGRRVGEHLARKAEISVIAFTGSQQVGTQLLQIGAQMQPGQQQVKRVIAEMGGKNAIIVDRDADLDDAVLGTVQSAFGYQGQKCSAASRVIVVGDIHDHFLQRLVEATRSLPMGSPENPANTLGPVIEEQAYSRILQAIIHGKQAGTLELFEDGHVAADGYYLPPAIFSNVDPASPLAQEEIFGPVLSVFRADSFDHAIALANNSRYALTGGLYSRQPSHLEQARREFNVGNLYLNRKISGALVSRQPFGGFKMSGAGAKAGGEDYLLQFMDTRCVTENTLRRGFAPKVDD